jgi:cobalt-zinc-cadmium efflux system outer membrane protein
MNGRWAWASRTDGFAVPAEGRYTEWDVGLERTVRLPGKRDLDQQLGAAGIATARVGRGEALHEAGRSLLAMWFDWLREESAVVQWRHQRDNLMQQARVLGAPRRTGGCPAPRTAAG